MKKHAYILLGISLLQLLPVYPANLIFDVGGVLFTHNITKCLNHIGHFNLVIDFFMGKKTHRIRERYFDLLLNIQISDISENSYQATYVGDVLPPILYAWMKNEIGWQDAVKVVEAHIIKLNISTYEKNIYFGLTKMVFDPHVQASIMKPMPEGIKLLKACAAEKNADGTPRHRLFIISNAHDQAFTLLEKEYPEIFSLFEDRIYVSGRLGLMKPEKEIYLKLLLDWNIDPQKEDTYFIDDQEENFVVPQLLGIKTLHVHKGNFKPVKSQLKFHKCIS